MREVRFDGLREVRSCCRITNPVRKKEGSWTIPGALFSLERNTYPQAEVAEIVDLVGEQVGAVGRVAVIECEVQSETVVRIGEDRDAYFGREVESPGVFVLLDNIVVRRELRVAGAQLHPDVGLEDAVVEPAVAARRTERQLEHGVFLVGRQRRAVVQVERPAVDVLEVGVERDERTHGHGRRDAVAALEVHAPARSLVGERFAQRDVDLPVDVDVGLGEDLRLTGPGKGQQQGAERCNTEVFCRFHDCCVKW